MIAQKKFLLITWRGFLWVEKMETKNFEVLSAALDGVNLVEASAGTGKTYSIALLFLRWILSEKYSGKVDSIVAVTFTNYATSELKERISAFLEKALQCLRNEKPEEIDPMIQKVCGEIPVENRARAEKKLKSAINGFDSASIFTIHGFCHRLILENAFEIGALFNLELAENSNVPHETAVDFFRRELSKENDRAFLNAAQKELTVKKFESLLRKAGNSLKSGIHISEDVIPDAAVRWKLASIYAGFLKQAPEIIRKNREKSEKMSFDDLISTVYEILCDNERADKLKSVMKKRYDLIMIDEFQDTDPIQYFIFKELFFDKNHTVFLIGDPKQSIYSFRNADIFSYLKTSSTVDRKYIMKTNFRSSAPAVRAVNNVFSEINFGIKEIEYSEINPKNEESSPLKIEKDSDFVSSPGMLVYEVESDEEIISNIKERVKNMLRPDSKYRLGERPVKSSDIAILARTNSFAKEIHDALKSENIPVSLESGSGKGFSVFETSEAKAVFKLMKAAETGGFSEFRAMLLTFFYHKTVDDLLCEKESSLQKLYDDFTGCFSEWDKKGFYALFSKFIYKEEILSEIMKEDIKTFNNIRHLSELVNNFETISGFSAANTADWFASRLENPEKDSTDEDSLRNSGNMNDAVRIMTLHKSKGLEFNIVFVSFNVKNRVSGNEWIPRHNYDPLAADYEKVISLEKSNTRDHSVKGDDEPEETREFYVGVTRAKYLTVYYLRKQAFDGTVDKKLKTLLENKQVEFVNFKKSSGENHVPFEFEDPLLKFKDVKLREPEKLESEIKQSVSISSFTGIVSANRGTDEYFAEKYDETSGENLDEPVVLPLKPDVSPEKKTVKMSAFPSGSEAGLALHTILEKVDFNKDDNTDFIRESLRKDMNFSDEELENMVSAVNGCITDLANVRMFGGKSLKDVPANDKSTETEFFLKIKEDVDKDKVVEIISGICPGNKLAAESLRKGFMHGYIDLALKVDGKYYIVDWKSNNLGSFPEDYSQEKIRKEMEKHRYPLQYMIYLAAFDKYISSVDESYSYSENFGGVRYVFLRGIDANDEKSGIFCDSPEEPLLRKFQQLFEGEK